MLNMSPDFSSDVAGRLGAGSTLSEDAFAKVVVDQMLHVGKGDHDQPYEHNFVYIDSTLALAGGTETPSALSREEAVERDNDSQFDESWTMLHRVGIAATDLYCRRVFGKPFDALPVIEKRRVLGALDRIRLVFQDGSGAGVFFAAAYHTLMKSRGFGPADRVASAMQPR